MSVESSKKPIRINPDAKCNGLLVVDNSLRMEIYSCIARSIPSVDPKIDPVNTSEQPAQAAYRSGWEGIQHIYDEGKPGNQYTR